MSPIRCHLVRWAIPWLALGCANVEVIEPELDEPAVAPFASRPDASLRPDGAGPSATNPPSSPPRPPISSQGSADAGSAPWDATAEGGLTVLTSDAGGDGGFPSVTADAGSDGREPPIVTADAGRDGGGPAATGDAGSCGTVIPVHRGGSDVLVVLDRSCSMARSILGGETYASDPNAKWNLALASLQTVLARYDARVRWGVVAFPTVGEGCATPGGGVDPRTLVEPQPLGAAAVVRALNGRGVAPFEVCGLRGQPHDTPLARALEVAATSRSFRDPTRAHHVLLVTDGIETCERSPLTALVRRTQALRGLGVLTAVVGFGRNESPEQLDAIAVAGGVPRSGTPRYHTASNAAALQTALDSIAGAAADCGFTLRDAPADPSRLRVVASGGGGTLSIPRDLTRNEGWDYDGLTRTLTLYGSACAALRTAAYSNLNVTYDCPAPRCVPQPEVCDQLDNDCDGVRDDDCVRQP